MTCPNVRSRLSAYLDGDLPLGETRELAAHLASCAGCRHHWNTLRKALDMLVETPRLAPSEPIAWRVWERLEVESRGPGLALLFRPFWAARPLILPSLVPAALVLVSILAAAVALDQNARPLIVVSEPVPLSGTEGNPLFPSTAVGVPRIRSRVTPAEIVLEAGEGTFFFETVVARDGSVSNVALLEGDKEQARPFVDALRSERFEPSRLAGRPVAVSVYRLISRMEVRAPRT